MDVETLVGQKWRLLKPNMDERRVDCGPARRPTIGYSDVGAVARATGLLARRERMIEWKVPVISEMRDSFVAILYVDMSAAATNLLNPLCTGMLTRVVSQHGPAAVAAYGVGRESESVAMIGIFASLAAGPFAGQNHGARRCARLREAIRF